MTVLSNGVAETEISVFDRGLQYGDGLFETLAVIDQNIHNWDNHFQRLKRGCETLKLHEPDEDLILSEVSELLDPQQRRQIIKVIITRGSGGRGYLPPSPQHNQRIISRHPWPQYPESYYSEGVEIAETTIQISRQPLLAGLKHLNRLEQVLARSELGDRFHEGLLCDDSGQIIEGVNSNIYFVNDGVLCSPELDRGGIAGTLREQVFELCHNNQIPYTTGHYHRDILYFADEVFMSNSIIGLWPVKSIRFLSRDKKPLFASQKSDEQYCDFVYSPGPIYQCLGNIINQQLLHLP